MLYVRLMSWITPSWQVYDYTYAAVSNPASVIVSPAQGGTIGASSVDFSWDAGVGLISERYLAVGTASDTFDLYGGYQGAGTTRTVTGIPINGSPIYVRLLSWVSGGWWARDYIYSTGAP